MNATQPPSTTTCAKCGASNAAVARFCGGCGAPLQAAAPPPMPPQPVYPQPPYPPQPPMTPQMPRVSMPGGGAGAQATIGADLQTAFGLAIQGMQGAGAQISGQSPPSAFTMQKTKSMLRFQGDVTLSPLAPNQTAIRISCKPTAVTVISMVILSLFVMTTWGRWMGQLGALLGLAAGAYSIWTMVTSTPRQLAEQMLASIPQPMSSAAGLYDPRRNGAPSPMQPAAMPVAHPMAASAGPSAGVVEQLKQLADLRSMGAVTQEEFERKKAELLQRI